ncbi:hypothetical protein [Oceanidesulfovibrio marinus]|uniref:Uncharacterized protein n=1 Tax=Oceanidesulfovibrio marinus TaxID=370038 RepID=A0A6P1ZHU7_9BACT|nr:hypothetical protein [Oceanidesulfovibrio marinus]TVM33147.1 hypothetical protein DQK91_13400 [Oceanidesulfovibrio marinus]
MANAIPLPKQSLIKILVCLAIIILFAFFFNIQSKNKVSRLNGDIVALKSEIKRQEILYPVYLDLKRQYEAEVLKELALVTNKAMTQEEVDAVTRQIEEAAVASKMEPQEVIPDPATLSENSGQVIVNCEFFGPFFNVRDLLKNRRYSICAPHRDSGDAGSTQWSCSQDEGEIVRRDGRGVAGRPMPHGSRTAETQSPVQGRG